MLDQVNALFGIKPDHDLNILTARQTLEDITARILTGVSGLIAAEAPDVVAVQGDTTTSFAAALAAFYKKVPVAHLEAGLRTDNIHNPFPEELNRRLATQLSALHLAPTATSCANLLRDGVKRDAIVVTGNTVIDALLRVARAVDAPGAAKDELDRTFSWIDPGKRLVLVTGHRRESFGDGFARICEALRAVARRADVEIVYPVHLNPNVRGPVFERLSGSRNIRLIEPLDYREFVYLMTRCHLILTDSGGVQEEAPSLRKPVLVMRDTSERLEAVEAGVARLVSTDPAAIVAAVDELLDSAEAYAAMASGANPFGDGRASERIVRDLITCKQRSKPSPSSGSAMLDFQPPRPLPRAALTSSA
jgi:UDP-N-acetylglucosamine 2-epimerase